MIAHRIGFLAGRGGGGVLCKPPQVAPDHQLALSFQSSVEGCDFREAQEVMRPDAENEIDLMLHQWWEIRGRINSRQLFLVPVVMFLIALWARWPSLNGCVIPSITVLSFLLARPMKHALSLRRKRSLAAVLWIRRFRRGALSQQLFGLWSGVVYPWGQLITLSDEDVEVLVIARKSIWLYLVLVVPFGVFFHLAGQNLSIVALALVAGFVVVWAYRSRIIVRSSGDLDGILRLARRFRSEGAFHTSGPATIRVLHDNEELWRSAILKLAPEVGAVIVDYGGGPSESIDWEVGTLLRICGPKKMILAIPESEATPAATTSEIESTFRRLCESSSVPQILAYPRRLPRSTFLRRYEYFVRPAQRMVGLAVTQAAVDRETR